LIPLKDDIPSNSFPIATVSLIIINAIVFLFQLSLGSRAQIFIYRFGAIPFELTHLKDIPPYVPIPLPLTLLTSMFMHGSILHILSNMLYLWIFGDNVEDVMGKFRFLMFYLICGFCAAAAHIVIEPSSKVPMVGASGAISGVLGAYLLLFPRANVYTLIVFFYFVQIIKLPALLLLTLWIGFQFLSGTASVAGRGAHGGVAWFAHIGGFFAGIVLVNFFRKRKKRGGAVWR